MSDSSLDQILAKRQHETKEIVNVDEPAIKLVICALGNDWFAFNGERIREILTKTIITVIIQKTRLKDPRERRLLGYRGKIIRTG